MKIVKKTLIIASTLALGLTLVGCNKKNVGINKYNVYKSAYEKPVSSAQNKKTIRIKNGSYSTVADRFVCYRTSNGQSVIYDPIENKEIYTTSDIIYDIDTYIDRNIFVITFDDDSQVVISTSGKTLAEKGLYSDVNLEIMDEENKNNKYIETTFYLLTKKVSEGSTVKFYKLTKNVSKNASNRLYLDVKLDYKLEEASEKDILEYKKGDTYPKSNKKYSCSANSSDVTFYDENSKRAILSIKSDADNSKVVMLKDKAIVQFVDKTTSEDNYDIYYRDKYYNVLTYKVDLKKGTYKKLDNYKYLLLSCDEQQVYDSIDGKDPNYYYLKRVYLIKDKTISNIIDITIDNNAKVVMDNQRYIYDNNLYYDLGNGNYITYDDVYDSVVYLTDKNGLVKKVFNGNAGVLYDSKVICIENNQELYLLDFKGNYITDKPIRFSGDLVFADQTHVYYTSQSDNKMRLLTLGDSKIVSDVEIEYKASISSSVTFSTTTINEEDRYYCDNNFYFTLEAADLNGDNIKDCYNIYYYSVNGNKIYQLDGIRNMSYHESTNIDGSTCYIALSTVYSTSTESELTISLFTK